MDKDLIVYMLLKTDWLCKKSQLRIQRSRASLCKTERFILETAGRVVQFDTDYRQRALTESWPWSVRGGAMKKEGA
jgi:hypothetical protein